MSGSPARGGAVSSPASAGAAHIARRWFARRCGGPHPHRLFDPVSDRPRRGLELPAHLLRRTARADQLDDLAAELRRVRRMVSCHRGTLLSSSRWECPRRQVNSRTDSFHEKGNPLPQLVADSESTNYPRHPISQTLVYRINLTRLQFPNCPLLFASFAPTLLPSVQPT